MMTVTVFYDGKEDDVFENVIQVDTLVKEKVLRVYFWDEGKRQVQLVYMDANTEVRFSF